MKLICPDFRLGPDITAEQTDFFRRFGFILFKDFIKKDRITTILDEITRIESLWIGEGRNKINGIPIRIGEDENGKKIIQRFCFLSDYSKEIQSLVADLKKSPLTAFLNHSDGRISEKERDGIVMNHYLRTDKSSYRKMGWHTDVLRDIFYGQRIQPMLNIGIHLDDCPYKNGGLRFLPGSHKQKILSLLFSKKHFIDNRPDPKEYGTDIQAGDLSVHDGRLWHRVQQSPVTGSGSRRRVIYVPIITGRYKPKSEKSKTPLYLKLSGMKILKKAF